MANPAPFAPVAYDSPDWVRTVIPVTVTGGSVVSATGLQPNQSASSMFTISGAASNVPAGWNDGVQHTLCAIQIGLTVVSFSGTAPWVGQMFVEDKGHNSSLAVCMIGIQSVPSTGQLPQSQSSLVYPNGFSIPKQALGTFALIWNFQVVAGSGSITLWAELSVSFV